MSSNEPATDAGVRIDRWLHATRWFKTRSLASDAIANGRILVNGVRAKAARTLRPGDTVTIHRPPQVHEVIVLGLSARRLGAALAQALYAETPASQARREALAAERALSAVYEAPAAGKLDRRDRRARERLKRGLAP